MYKIGLLSLLFMMISTPVFAHSLSRISIIYNSSVSQDKRDILWSTTKEVEAYFKDQLGITLTRRINIYVVTNDIQYKETLCKLLDDHSDNKVNNIIARSSATTIGHNIIVVAGDYNNIKIIGRLVAHELTHQYQEQTQGAKALKNMWIMEGTAEYIGYMFGDGIPFVTNQGIPKEEITTYNQWITSGSKYTFDKVYRQCLYNVIQNIKEDKNAIAKGMYGNI